MDLAAYIKILWYHRWIVLFTTVVTFGIAVLGTLLAKPVYSTSTTLRLVRDARNTMDYQEILYGDRLLGTYAQIATSEVTRLAVGRRLGLAIVTTVEAEPVVNSELLQIVVEGPEPAGVQQFAVGLAETLLNYNQEDTRSSRAPGLVMIEPPGFPAAPVSPRPVLSIALGLLLGLVGGFSLALLFENLAPRLHTASQAAAAVPAKVLSEVPRTRMPRGSGRARSPAFLEAFRRLQINLNVLADRSAATTYMVGGAEAGEGKTTVAAELGLAFARAGRKTLLVDYNVKRPALHALFGLPNDRGLSTLLCRQEPAAQCIQSAGEPELYLLPSGPAQPDLDAHLAPAHLAAIIAVLAAEYEIVIFDTAAFLDAADNTVLAAAVDQVLLVVAPGVARRAALQFTLAQLDIVHATLVGLVINHCGRSGSSVRGRAASIPAPAIPGDKAVLTSRGNVHVLEPTLARGPEARAVARGHPDRR